MEQFRVSPISEADVEAVIRAAGGCRAHADADKRTLPGADFRLAESVIELKALDEDGMVKSERQQKIADLFQKYQSGRPVVVLDRRALPEDGQREYDRIVEGPIKSGVAKARKQLKQSRLELPDTTTSICLFINNGYTALGHDEVKALAAHRARQDSREIDGVVVAGCYFFSDGFESCFLWPIDYVPINLDRPFASYDALLKAWHDFSLRFMTKVVRGELPADNVKGPVVDTQFDVSGITYVLPAPPMGKESDFYIHGRPRKDSTGLKRCPAVAQTFPEISQNEWARFREACAESPDFPADYKAWQYERAIAVQEATALVPFVPMRVTYEGWRTWLHEAEMRPTFHSICHYAKKLFNRRASDLLDAVREWTGDGITPARYVCVVTEEIGQDRANDLSHIAIIREQPFGDPLIRPLVDYARIFHDHAIILACAYGVAEGVESVMWRKDLQYAWI